ncbi:proto-oncogene Mas-like [Sceloporus undulatus]|uniref:proto-oncogene Mas-like n=1 Tax=Sceloporus undulatus TaxID=8520 RepID=UPI001C4BCA56|nr:proto-oncogene Mas-like [Sceloporus undulatus]
MTNDSMSSLPPLDDGEEYYTYNETEFPYELILLCPSECKVISSFAFLVSTFGLVGNGTVIWLLGFRMKRNPFTTFILNLAVADLGVLICIVVQGIVYIIYFFLNRNMVINMYSLLAWMLLSNLFFLMYFTGQFLLTAISIDRCVSVLFPIWHRCHRPTYLSTTVCAILWVTSCLLYLLSYVVFLTPLLEKILIMLTVIPFLCLPLMIISSLILFIKVCFKSPKHKQGKTLRAIFLIVLFFLMFAFPLTATSFIYMFIIPNFQYHIITQYSFLGASLNSSVNPFIYFLLGRQKAGQKREKMKNILQRLFKEEEGYGADTDSTV